MRPLIRRTNLSKQVGGVVTNSHAISYIVDSMGAYCAICEKPIASYESLHHRVLGKLDQDVPEKEINDLLLTCGDCNIHRSNDTMNSQSTLDMLWPDLDSSFSLHPSSPIRYVKKQVRYIVEDNGNDVSDQNSEMVIIEVNEQANSELQRKAQNTINYFKLNTPYYIASENVIKVPLEYKLSMSDHRLLERNEAWLAAQNASERLKVVRAVTNVPEILKSLNREITRTLKAKGNWSVWLTVFSQNFSDEKDLLEKLFIRDGDEHFNGTCYERMMW